MEERGGHEEDEERRHLGGSGLILRRDGDGDGDGGDRSGDPSSHPWPTVDGPLGLSEEESVAYARTRESETACEGSRMNQILCSSSSSSSVCFPDLDRISSPSPPRSPGEGQDPPTPRSLSPGFGDLQESRQAMAPQRKEGSGKDERADGSDPPLVSDSFEEFREIDPRPSPPPVLSWERMEP